MKDLTKKVYFYQKIYLSNPKTLSDETYAWPLKK